MSLATMMTEVVEIWRYTKTGEDSTGDEIRTWALLSTVDAWVSHSKSDETVVGRDQVVVDWSFMLPAGTDVIPYDRLSHLGRMFEVVGLPAPAIKPGSGEQFRVAKARWIEG